MAHYSIAIVGAGPAGYFTAQALQNAQSQDLTSRYDAVVMCTGSAIGRKLGIPGEDLIGSISAAEFVPWYNGHPDSGIIKK